MLSPQILLWTFTLLSLIAPSLCDPLGKLHSSHGRISHRSYHHRGMQAENTSSSVPVLAQPFVHDINPTRTVKRGPRILDYKLVDAKGSKTLKRTTDDLNSAALFNFPNCLLCEGKRKDDLGLSVSNNFQARQMVDMMEPGGFMGECLFCRLHCSKDLTCRLTVFNRWSTTTGRDLHAGSHNFIARNYRLGMSARSRKISNDLGKHSVTFRIPPLIRFPSNSGPTTKNLVKLIRTTIV
jgi:hypothetical protein